MGGRVGGRSLCFLYCYSFRISVSVSCSVLVRVQYVTFSSSFLGLRFRSGPLDLGLGSGLGVGLGSGLGLGLGSGLGSGVVHLSEHCDGLGIRGCLLRSVLHLPRSNLHFYVLTLRFLRCRHRCRCHLPFSTPTPTSASASPASPASPAYPSASASASASAFPSAPPLYLLLHRIENGLRYFPTQNLFSRTLD